MDKMREQNMNDKDTFGCTSTLRRSSCEAKIHVSAHGGLPKVGIKSVSGWVLFPNGHVVCRRCVGECVDVVRNLQEQFE